MADGAPPVQFDIGEWLNRTCAFFLVLFTAILVLILVVPAAAEFAGRYLIFDSDCLRRGEVWRLVTASAVHLSPCSFLMPAFVFWSFGNPLASYWRPLEFVGYIVVCSVGGWLTVALLAWLSGRGVQGAGAWCVDFGLLAAFYRIFGERTVLVNFVCPMKARTVAVVVAVVAVLFILAGRQFALLGMLGGGVTGWFCLSAAWAWHDRRAGVARGPVSSRSRIAGLEVMDDHARK